MADSKISEMTTASIINDNDYLEMSQGSGSTWATVKGSILAIATKIVTNIQFTSALNTTAKTVAGAINELKPVELTDTLTAGSTSITFTDASITTSSTVEVFNDLDVPYNSKTLSTGSLTLTFDAQVSNMAVKVRLS